VLSSEIELRDLDERHWHNWWRLLVPPRVRAGAPWALVVLAPRAASARPPGREGAPAAAGDHGALAPSVLKVVISRQGARDPARWPPPLADLSERSLAAWARALGVEAIVALESDLLARLSAEIEAELRLGDDYAAQGLTALRAVRRYVGAGVWTSPPILELLPAPRADALQRTFDLLVPDRSALAAYVIEDDRRRVHASIIAVKDRGDVARVTTHRAIADLVPEAALAQSWDDPRRGHGRAIAAIEDRLARPSAAVFLERATLLRVLTGPSDQLAREVSARRVVIEPAPAWLLGLLGGAAVAAVAGRAAGALAQLLPQGARDRATALASRARGAMQDSGAHPFALLGFDPLELWAQLRRFYRE
jgi:hypothetical protein